MQFQFGFKFYLYLIPFSQGIRYTFLGVFKSLKTEKKSNYWLRFFIFLCSLFIALWMLGFADWYDNQPYRDVLFYTPFQYFLFIGPVLYYYTKSLLNADFRFSKKKISAFYPRNDDKAFL
ncbi:hypothetical protein SAMN05444395_101686 [Flavobacterium fryxellicola]|uniref:Uncharacterized protein n=1 Tax=Flavobacterium fryxellicola TaxID=249352 RepID=A0A168ACQ7_9FLAO|nr:hypothetical protein FBFR_00480 [Flavobacterium fryxellicola]SHN54633.1 hypothetical protein SAMN05444395_101686 [Flavobacterium fryxellicola]